MESLDSTKKYAYKYTVRTHKLVGGTDDTPQYEFGESLPFTVSHSSKTEWSPDTGNTGKITIKFNKPPFGDGIRLYRIVDDTIYPVGISSAVADSDSSVEEDDLGNLAFTDDGSVTNTTTKIPAARDSENAGTNTVAISETDAGFDSTHVFYPQLVLDEGAIQIIATNPAVANSVD